MSMENAILINIALTVVAMAAVVLAAYAYARYKWFLLSVPIRRDVVAICNQVLEDRESQDRAKAYAVMLGVFVSTPGALRKLAKVIHDAPERSSKEELLVHGDERHIIERAIKLTATACMLEDWRLAPRVAKALRANEDPPREMRRTEVSAVQFLLANKIDRVPLNQLRTAFQACHV